MTPLTDRVLPPAEYGRLAGTEAAQIPELVHPGDAIVVVERDGVIVGCHTLLQIWHLEGLWKAPGAGTGVSRRLWSAVQREARARDVRCVVTSAIDDRVRGLLAHVGATRLPGDAYVVPIGGR